MPTFEDAPKDLPQDHPPGGRQPDLGESPSTDSGTIRPDALTSLDPLSPRSTPRMPPPPMSPTLVGSKSPPVVPSGQQILQGTQGYELLERIGKGTYGEVFRARAPGGVIVAVKRLFRPVEDVLSQKELEALERMRELNHPFLLQMHSYQPVDGRLAIVMELADGSLEDRFKEYRKRGLPGIPLEELLNYFTEAAAALDFLHEQKLSHRDIKPQNLLHLKGYAKVADFGIARVQVDELDHTMAPPSGTAAYMAPEVWGGAISVHSDQYSFAVTWYEMRTNRLPFPGKKLLEIGRQHVNDKPDLSGVPEPEQNVLLKALAKHPDERFPSCTEFVQALREATAPPKPPVRERGFGLKTAILMLVFMLTSILIAVFWPRPPDIVETPAAPLVSWKPPGWEPEPDAEIVQDRNEHRYYKRLARMVGNQKVVMVLAPSEGPQDPRTFYIMENKVWNDLFAVFMADPKAAGLLKKYRDQLGPELVPVESDWRKGGYVIRPEPGMPEMLGVEGEFRGQKIGSFPVFQVKVHEAHCFAEWLGGKLPTVKEWVHAAGKDKDDRQGPFGDLEGDDKFPVGLGDGPRPVTWGKNHVSIYGCRQMAGNGSEWTRDLFAAEGNEEIPLEGVLATASVRLMGRGYTSSGGPLTFQEMTTLGVQPCSESSFEIGFRVVLEQDNQ